LELTREHIDELIAKYLSGEALPDEAMMLDDWKDMSDENLRYFNECEQVFTGTVYREPDISMMFKRVMDDLQEEPQRAKVIPLHKRYFSPLGIAASLLIVSLIGVLAVYFAGNGRSAPEMMIASADSTSAQQLADGSQVFLNKHTTLTVAKGFNGRQRKLKLEGEAYFEVVHDDDKPFVIEAGGLEITDIGTAFNVKAHPQSDSVTVYVTEGIVDISTGNKTMRLLANQSAVYVRSSGALEQTKAIERNAAAYKTKVFRFNASTLGEVVAALNTVYGTFIIVQDHELLKCRITVDFNNESPETILAIITETLGLRYEEKGPGIFEIKGAACIQ
jgi:transmembrane sensor